MDWPATANMAEAARAATRAVDRWNSVEFGGWVCLAHNDQASWHSHRRSRMYFGRASRWTWLPSRPHVLGPRHRHGSREGRFRVARIPRACPSDPGYMWRGQCGVSSGAGEDRHDPRAASCAAGPHDQTCRASRVATRCCTHGCPVP